MHSMTLGKRSVEQAVAVERSDAAELETLYIGLVRDYHQRIFNYSYRLVGDPDVAEDLTQETFLRAYRSLPRLPVGANHRAWLFRIATNAATDEIRRRKRRPSVPLAAAIAQRLRAPTESEDQRLGRVSLERALQAVGPQHRVILTLFEFAEFSAPEVGEVLGISPATARKRRQRARHALAEALERRP
jgi:RNA polymerase sigma-70 factor (ECF subfamily)